MGKGIIVPFPCIELTVPSVEEKTLSQLGRGGRLIMQIPEKEQKQTSQKQSQIMGQ